LTSDVTKNVITFSFYYDTFPPRYIGIFSVLFARRDAHRQKESNTCFAEHSWCAGKMFSCLGAICPAVDYVTA